MNNNVIPFTHQRKAREEKCERACIWLTRLDAGATFEDKQELGRWLDEDASHPRILLEMAALWDQMSMLSELSEIFPLDHYARLQQNRLHRRRRLLIASALLVGGVALGGAAFMHGELARYLERDTKTNYQTAVGERRTLTLPDGSEVMLNTNTL
ncbi:MAG: hypothetical protein LBE21_11140, partial [Pseudomonadales bacterium]|nr:hypothetical protein [Pseudomonadales bacterium]